MTWENKGLKGDPWYTEGWKPGPSRRFAYDVDVIQYVHAPSIVRGPSK